jgi:GntR family transcriptional regulator
MAAFAIERLGRAGTRQVEWRTTLVRGDRYSVMVEWTPAARYSVDLIGERQS